MALKESVASTLIFYPSSTISLPVGGIVIKSSAFSLRDSSAGYHTISVFKFLDLVVQLPVPFYWVPSSDGFKTRPRRLLRPRPSCKNIFTESFGSIIQVRLKSPPVFLVRHGVCSESQWINLNLADRQSFNSLGESTTRLACSCRVASLL